MSRHQDAAFAPPTDALLAANNALIDVICA